MSRQQESDPRQPDPRQALTLARLIWAALLGGQIVIAVAVVLINRTAPFIEEQETARTAGAVLAGVSGLMLLSAVPAALFVRGQVFKRHWVGDAVQPGGYLTGCLIAWAAVEGASIVGLLAALLGGSLWPYGLPAAAALGLLLALRPNGEAMRPTPNPDAAARRTS